MKRILLLTMTTLMLLTSSAFAYSEKVLKDVNADLVMRIVHWQLTANNTLINGRTRTAAEVMSVCLNDKKNETYIMSRSKNKIKAATFYPEPGWILECQYDIRAKQQGNDTLLSIDDLWIYVSMYEKKSEKKKNWNLEGERRYLERIQGYIDRYRADGSLETRFPAENK